MKPYSPIPRFVRGSDHAGLIHRLLRSDLEPDIQRIDLITTTQLRLSVLDSGYQPVEHRAEGDTCIHVLWQANESEASIRIGEEQLAISPGDTTWIPAGDTWQLSADQLAICIVVRSNTLAMPIKPSHGEERFVGHNRETHVPKTSGISLRRWKLTEPLTIEASDEEIILVGLYADIAIQFAGGVTMLTQGEASVIRPGTGQITLIPNGLSYILILDTLTAPRDQLV